jgi:hypothetical protein
MPAPIKITRPLAALLMRDLRTFIATAQRAGIALPKAELRYADGLTREDAQALYEWGMQIPQVRAAYGNATDPDHQAVRSFKALTDHFTHDHPQRPEGGPADWTTPLSAPLRALITGEADSLKLAELTGDEARAYLDWAGTRADVTEALHDKANPLHETITREMREITEAVARPAPPPDAGAQDGRPATSEAQPDRQARIAELNQRLRETPKGGT